MFSIDADGRPCFRFSPNGLRDDFRKLLSNPPPPPPPPPVAADGPRAVVRRSRLEPRGLAAAAPPKPDDSSLSFLDDDLRPSKLIPSRGDDGELLVEPENLLSAPPDPSRPSLRGLADSFLLGGDGAVLVEPENLPSAPPDDSRPNFRGLPASFLLAESRGECSRFSFRGLPSLPSRSLPALEPRSKVRGEAGELDTVTLLDSPRGLGGTGGGALLCCCGSPHMVQYLAPALTKQLLSTGTKDWGEREKLNARVDILEHVGTSRADTFDLGRRSLCHSISRFESNSRP